MMTYDEVKSKPGVWLLVQRSNGKPAEDGCRIVPARNGKTYLFNKGHDGKSKAVSHGRWGGQDSFWTFQLSKEDPYSLPLPKDCVPLGRAPKSKLVLL